MLDSNREDLGHLHGFVETHIVATTNDRGEFELHKVPDVPGIRLRIERAGYRTESVGLSGLPLDVWLTRR